MYTVITQAVHVWDTACLRTCNENYMSCVLISTRDQSWNIRQPCTLGTRSVYIQYTSSSCIQAVDGSVHAANLGIKGNRIRSVHVQYKFSFHPVYLLCTGRGRTVDWTGQYSRSLHEWKPYTISALRYTSGTPLVYRLWTSSRRVSTRGHSCNVRKSYTISTLQYTSGTPLVCRPWTGSGRVSTHGHSCNVRKSYTISTLQHTSTSGTPLVCRPWTGNRRVRTHG